MFNFLESGNLCIILFRIALVLNSISTREGLCSRGRFAMSPPPLAMDGPRVCCPGFEDAKL
jgi:hypothetical protein